MDRKPSCTETGYDDRLKLLLGRIVPLLEQVRNLDRLLNELVGKKCEQLMSLDDLQQAILHCEKLASQGPNHFLFAVVWKGLDLLAQKTKPLFSIKQRKSAHPVVPRMKPESCVLAPPQILFERWEIDVDDIEAPLPDPFDNEKPAGGGALVNGANGTRDQVTGLRKGGKYADNDVSKAGEHEEKFKQTVEVYVLSHSL